MCNQIQYSTANIPTRTEGQGGVHTFFSQYGDIDPKNGTAQGLWSCMTMTMSGITTDVIAKSLRKRASILSSMDGVGSGP